MEAVQVTKVKERANKRVDAQRSEADKSTMRNTIRKENQCANRNPEKNTAWQSEKTRGEEGGIMEIKSLVSDRPDIGSR